MVGVVHPSSWPSSGAVADIWLPQPSISPYSKRHRHHPPPPAAMLVVVPSTYYYLERRQLGLLHPILSCLLHFFL